MHTHTTIQNIYSLSNEMLLHKQGNKGAVDFFLYSIINIDDGLGWMVMHMEKDKVKWNEISFNFKRPDLWIKHQ